ncbi:hypothetical protein FSP39_017310 [Pinctada imbricata]|uniref:FAS1 domain-containing protein n=1 Tax=Pinctada imbricata TaxID=66713 RepID=A0AA88XUJ1_PINIB|nr:hypothetical protein FSP39_017310 [Pinctada imbricata]
MISLSENKARFSFHRQRLHPWTYNAPSLLHYHVTRGRHNYSDFKDSQIETLYYGQKYLRINKYRHGIVTVNCARIGPPNQLAQNGIIHTIDRMLKPMDILGDISSFILRDPRFTQFARIIYAADMVNYFRTSTLYTVFVPDDQALGNMPKELSTRIFSDRKIARVKTSIELLRDNQLNTMVDLIHRGGHRHTLLKDGYTLFAPSDEAFNELPPEYLSTLKSEPGLVEKLISYHTVPSSLLLDNMIHGQLFDTKMPNTHIKVTLLKNDILINDAHISSPDLESSNAVVHVIDKVLVPPEHSLLEVIRRDPTLR